jgi:hypothetical protein
VEDRTGAPDLTISPVAATTSVEPATLADVLASLRVLPSILARLADALEARPDVPRLAYRLKELARACGVSRRVLERERAAGRLPPADLHIGRIPLYTQETIRRWIEDGGR